MNRLAAFSNQYVCNRENMPSPVIPMLVSAWIHWLLCLPVVTMYQLRLCRCSGCTPSTLNEAKSYSKDLSHIGGSNGISVL